MTFASRDAFPARGGVDDKPDRFPLSPRPSLHGPTTQSAEGASPETQPPETQPLEAQVQTAQPCGSIGTQLAQSCDSSVTDSPLPSGLGSPGWVGARDGTPGGACASKTATSDSARSDSATARSSYVELHAHSAYSFLDGASLPEELA